MIRAYIALNGDGHVEKQSLLALPSDVFESDVLQLRECLENTLVMASMNLGRTKLPNHLAAITRKSLIAENDVALSTMAANIVDKEIGDISICANSHVIECMDNISMTYELVIVRPNGVTAPDWLCLGKRLITSNHDEEYTVDQYNQSVANASDTQIADYINGLESYYNMLDSMDQQSKDAVNKITHGIQMVNRAIQREDEKFNRMAISNTDFEQPYDNVESMDIGDEMDRVWDTLDMISNQLSDTTDLVLSNQSATKDIMNFVKTMVQSPQLITRCNLLGKEIDGLRNQFGAQVQESNAMDKRIESLEAKMDDVLKILKFRWVLYVLVVALLALSVINLLV